MKRRNLLLGLGGLAGASGAVGTGAFSSITANRDVTVSVADDTDALLKLEPSPAANGEYATKPKQNGGLIALDFTETEEGGKGLGTDSVYTFDDVFRVTNQGTQPVYVWGTFDGGSGNFTAGGDDTDIWLYPDGDSTTKLRDNSDGVERLGVGDTVHVGVYVDTHDVISDQTLTLTMTIHADAEKPAGAPGSAGPPAPITAETEEREKRFFHSLPEALSYVDDGTGIEVEVDEGSYPRATSAIRVTDPISSRRWVEYELSSQTVEFTGAEGDEYSITLAADSERAQFDFTDEPVRATIQGPELEDDFGETVGLSELLEPEVTSVGKDGLSFGSNDGRTYPGTSPFVFSKPGDANQAIALVASADGSEIERVRFTTKEQTLEFTDPATLRTALSILIPQAGSISVNVPDTLTLKGTGGKPTIEHALRLEDTLTQSDRAVEQRIRLEGLKFGEAPSGARESVAVESGGDTPIYNLSLADVVFTPDPFSAGLRIKNETSGLFVENCRIYNRVRGVTTEGRSLWRVRVADTLFKNTDTGFKAGDVREAYIYGRTKFDGGETRTPNSIGIDIEDPEGVGIKGVEITNFETGIEFDGGVADVDDGTPLADQIESNIPASASEDSDIGASGIVNGQFLKNDLNVKNGSNSDDFPVAEDTEFSPENTADDIDLI